MSDDVTDKDIIVETDDVAAPKTGEVITEPASSAKSNDDAAASLAEQLKTAEAAREAAERLAASRQQAVEAEREARLAAEDNAKRFSEESRTHEMAVLTNAIDAATQARDGAKREYADAMANNDYTRAADAQDRLSTAAARLVHLESVREATERSTARVEPTEGRVTRQQPTQQVDPVEHYLSQFSPRSQAWLRLHPECVTDSRRNAQMMSAHYEAIGQGLEPETPAYFNLVEQRTGYRKGAEIGGDTELPVQRGAPPVAAPVSREAPNARPTNPTRIRLNKEQQEAASLAGISQEQYAANLIALQNEGKIGRTTH